MTGVPDGLALNLGAGQVLVGPKGVLYVARALAAAERAARRDGLLPPPEFVALCEAVMAAAGEVRASAAGRSEVPLSVGVAASVVSSVLVDPITTAQAAQLLGCTDRNVRDLCRRGGFGTARRERGGWVVERDEVTARLYGHGRAATEFRTKGEQQHDVSSSRRPAA